MRIDTSLIRAAWLRMAGERMAVGFLGLLLAVPMPAAAWNLREQISEPAWTWARPQEYGLPGARVRVQHFDAAVEPAQVARRLVSLAPDRFVRLQFSGPSLSLSGMAAGAHWLAHLQKTPAGTTGMVSSLTPGDDVRGISHFDLSALIPCHAAPAIRVFSRDPIPASMVRVACPGTERQILDQLRHRLRLGRWEPVDGNGSVSGLLARDWRHASGAVLSVLSETRAPDVVLTLWRRESESRP